MLILRRSGTGVAVRNWPISPLSRATAKYGHLCLNAYYAMLVILCSRRLFRVAWDIDFGTAFGTTSYSSPHSAVGTATLTGEKGGTA